MLAESLYSQLKKEGIDWVATGRELDLFDHEAVDRLIQAHRPDHMINCSAYTNVEGAETDQAGAFFINETLVGRLGEIANHRELKITHFSTDYVFDGKRDVPYTEECQAAPLNVYGKSKLAGEVLLRKKCPWACVIRTSWLYGLTKNPFPRKMVELMQTTDRLIVVSDQIGSPTFTRDLAEFTCLLDGTSGLFHVSGGGHTSWYEWAQMIFEWARDEGLQLKCQEILSVKTEKNSCRATRPQYSVLDTTKVSKVANKEPRFWKFAFMEYLNESSVQLA